MIQRFHDSYARQVIAKELIGKAKDGKVDDLRDQLESLARDAERHNEKRPRGSAQTRDEKGNTLLSVAVTYDKIEVAKMLLDRSKALPKDMELRAKTAEEKVWHSKVNCRDVKGWTPVCIASFKRNAKMVELLLSHGADPRLPNQYNKTAFDFVRKKVDILNNVNDEGDPVIFEMLSRWDSTDATAKKIQHSVASNEVASGPTETHAETENETDASAATAAAATDTAAPAEKTKSKRKAKGRNSAKDKGKSSLAAGSGASAVKSLNDEKKKGKKKKAMKKKATKKKGKS